MWPAALERLSEAPIQHATETVILARRCDMPELLKRALYELLRTARRGQDEDADLEDPDVARKLIPRQDLVRLIVARDELVDRWCSAAVGPPKIPCSLSGEEHSNEAKAKCLQARNSRHTIWETLVMDSGLFEDGRRDPLHGLQCLIDIDWTASGFCQDCVQAWRASWIAQRQKLWQQLDVWLGLPARQTD